MRDFNFFESYISQPDKKHNDNYYITAAAACVMALMLAFFGINSIRIMVMERETQELLAITQSPQYADKYKAILEKERELETLKDEQVFFAEMEKYMKQNDYVNETFIRFLGSEVPENVNFTDLSIENRNILLEGTALSKLGIAQLEYNLRQTEDFSNIFIPEIEKEKAFYNFIMVLQTKDVTADENK